MSLEISSHGSGAQEFTFFSCAFVAFSGASLIVQSLPLSPAAFHARTTCSFSAFVCALIFLLCVSSHSSLSWSQCFILWPQSYFLSGRSSNAVSSVLQSLPYWINPPLVSRSVVATYQEACREQGWCLSLLHLLPPLSATVLWWLETSCEEIR